MKHTKKLLALVLAGAMLLACCAIPAAAGSTPEPAPELWVRTVPNIPNSTVAKAYQLMFSKFGYPTGAPTDPDSNRPITLGSPFWTPTSPGTDGPAMCYFPILQDGKVCLTYLLYRSGPLGRWGSVGGATLVEELNAFIGDTSPAKPLVIYLDENEDVVLQSEHIKKTVEIDPTKDRVPTSDKPYEELLPDPDVPTGQVSVNVMEPARLVWRIPLWSITTAWITLTLRPFQLRCDMIY